MNQVSNAIHDVRKKAGLTQRELAAKIKTTASAICRLESETYHGHTLAILHKIAAATNTRVDIVFINDGGR